jgi:hypothetical protein
VGGLAAISANNGWAMAVAGAIIVMCGLAALSFIISQLHRMIALFENIRGTKEEPVDSEPSLAQLSMEIDILDDLAAAARIFRPLTEQLGDRFELSKLYNAFRKEDLPHPHLTIRALREGGFLLQTGEGTFCWKSGIESTL